MLHLLTHSFPPRRSSDLSACCPGSGLCWRGRRARETLPCFSEHPPDVMASVAPACSRLQDFRKARKRNVHRFRWEILRSEEHTSELQSLMRISYAVFCLKKKNNPA